MKIIEVKAFLPADTSVVWSHILQPRLLSFVARGLLTFQPIDPVVFPERWATGEYRVRKYLWGWLPLGWQVISIEFLPDQGQTRRLRDNGCGFLVLTWDHTIEAEPVGGGTQYVDRLKIEAGVLTPLVAAFARRFYEHRQQRLKKLVTASFDYEVN